MSAVQLGGTNISRCAYHGRTYYSVSHAGKALCKSSKVLGCVQLSAGESTTPLSYCRASRSAVSPAVVVLHSALTHGVLFDRQDLEASTLPEAQGRLLGDEQRVTPPKTRIRW